MHAFVAKLARALADLERSHAPAAYVVAFSGGLDSTVLLAACQRGAATLPLRAFHVDHGLHPDSARWAAKCRDASAALGVAFDSARLELPREDGRSLEAIAREARYRTLGAQLRPGEMLLTAHHEQDQLETLLLRLVRGAGVKGLRGIAAGGELAAGYLGRPLLAFAKAEIVDAAGDWGLTWLEDPSNADDRFDRNYLRRVVLPALQARWPGATHTGARTARQMADAQGLLEHVAAADASGVDDPARVARATLLALAPARLRNLLRHLIDARGLPSPSAAQLEELVAALCVARRDARTRVSWPGAEARVYGDTLYLMAPLAPHSPRACLTRVSPAEAWAGAEGRVALVPAASADTPQGLPEAWVTQGLALRFRCGGERFKPAGGAHRRELKKLLQEARIVPWMRSRIPLLFRDQELVAVGDLWVCEAARAERDRGRAWQVSWSEHPPLY